MVMRVERKHWYTQLPVSWLVEVVLVIALLAGTAFAATQVRGRDAAITDQSAVISQQAATLGTYREITTSWEQTAQQYAADLLDQRAIVQQQTATIQQSEAQLLTLREVAKLDAAIIEVYGLLQLQQLAMEQALRGQGPEAYQAAEIAWAGAEALKSRVADLTAQRQKLLFLPPGADT